MAPDAVYAIIICVVFAAILASAAAGALVQWARERRNGPRSGETRAAVASGDEGLA